MSTSSLKASDINVQEMEPVLSARWVFKFKHLAVCLIFGGMFAYVNCMPLLDSSIWLHMGDGAWILEHGALPEVDVAQPLSEGMRVVHTAWLSKVLYALGGPHYASNLFALATLANLLILGRIFYLQTGRLVMMVAGIGIALLLGSRLSFFASPEVFGQVCFALLLLIVMRVHSTGLGPMLDSTDKTGSAVRGSWRVWLAVAVLFAFWANLHASFLLGVVVLLCCAVSSAIDAAIRIRSFRDTLSDKQPRRWLLLAEMSLLASMLNPYGPRLIWDVLATAFNEKVTSLPQWLPLNIAGPNGLLFLGSLVLLAVVMRHSRRPVRPVEVLLLTSFGAMTIPSAMALGWYAVVYAFVVLPHVAEIWCRVFPETVDNGSTAEVEAERRLSARNFTVTLVCALVLYVGFRWAPISRELLGGTPRTMSALVGSEDVYDVAEHLREHPSKGLVYAPVEWADWLVWHGHGDVQVLMTSNVHWAPRRIWSDHRRMATGQEGWYKGMDRYGVETLVIDKENEAYFAKIAQDSHKFYTVYENDTAVVLRRHNDMRRQDEIGKIARRPSGEPESDCCAGCGNEVELAETAPPCCGSVWEVGQLVNHPLIGTTLQ